MVFKLFCLKLCNKLLSNQSDSYKNSNYTSQDLLQRVENFLNLTSEIKENNFFFNVSKKFYCGREVRTHGVWQCSRDKCLGKAKGRPKPPISQGTIERLASFFTPHNKMFYQLVNRDFGWPTS